MQGRWERSFITDSWVGIRPEILTQSVKKRLNNQPSESSSFTSVATWSESVVCSYFKQKLGDLEVAVGAGVVKRNQAAAGKQDSG